MAPTEPEMTSPSASDDGGPVEKKQKTTTPNDGENGSVDNNNQKYPENDDEIWKSQTWTNPDGSKEDIIEVEDEPRHHINFVNDHTKIITIKFPSKDTTCPHRHEKDTIIIILMKDGIDFINDVLGTGPQKGHMAFGQLGFAPFTKSPCVHKITNLSDAEMFCINVEVHDTPPLVQEKELALEKHTLIMTQYNCRVYSLKLEAGESTEITYPFFYVRCIVRGGTIKIAQNSGEGLAWEEKHKVGETLWKEPCSKVKMTNTSEEQYEAYICEFI